MKIYEKLLELQQEFKSLKNKKNQFGGFNYRSVESILSDLKPYLAQKRLVLTFSEEISAIGQTNILKCTVRLISVDDDDEVIETTSSIIMDLQLKGMCTAQTGGSDISYLRKYAIQGLLAIDDGSSEIDSMDFTGNKKTGMIDRIDSCLNINELNKLYQSLSDEEKIRYKNAFTYRKNKLNNK